jgi:GT2 family glycosyltransferase
VKHASCPLIAVIILTWNQRDLTLDCLTSLFAMDYPSARLQVIVVDNGSSDGTAAAVRTQFAACTVLENSENLGFAEGNNVGIRHALQGAADYVMLLNNDTIVDGAMLVRLLEVIEQQPETGIVGPKMLYYDYPNVIWCAGNELGRRPWISRRLQAGELDSPGDLASREVDFITACGILLRREVVEQVGLFDARFYLYYEETDWCMRARRAGWRIRYVPAARLWHRVSASIGPASPAIDYYMNRNVFLFVFKNTSKVQRLYQLPVTLIRQLLAIGAYTLKSQKGTRRANRDARILALRDAATGRWGKMRPDVAAICHQGK